MTFEEISNEYYKEKEIHPLRETKQSIDWEQRRYEIAKDVLTAYLSNSNPNMLPETMINLSKSTVELADALIEELKK